MRALKSSGNPRKAVTDQGKGAMLRRGAVKTKESFRRAGVRSKRMKDWSQIIREVTSI